MTAGGWLAKARDYLESHSVPEAQASAEFILAHVLKVGRLEARLDERRALDERQGLRFWQLVKKRGRRLPLAYVLGTQPFMGLEIEVDSGVLVPRPETEEVVAEALRLLAPRAGEPLHLLELGTGTGCIAVALSANLPRAVVWATDISPAALRLAARNAEAHARGGAIRFLKEDLFRPEAAPRGWADLVISNPPYIPTRELAGLSPEVRAEPFLALDGGPDGLDAIRALVAAAPRWLKPGGFLVLEIGSDQGPRVLRLLVEAGLSEGAVAKDSSGRDRIASAKMVK